MLNMINKKILYLFAFFISALAMFTVNSTCWIGLGQDNEPESLKRLKKLK